MTTTIAMEIPIDVLKADLQAPFVVKCALVASAEAGTLFRLVLRHLMSGAERVWAEAVPLDDILGSPKLLHGTFHFATQTEPFYLVMRTRVYEPVCVTPDATALEKLTPLETLFFPEHIRNNQLLAQAFVVLMRCRNVPDSLLRPLVPENVMLRPLLPLRVLSAETNAFCDLLIEHYHLR